MSRNDSFQVINDDSEGREFERSPINSLILDYYKRFARERGLEHYFSLTTAQREYKDPHSAFWRNLKTMADVTDSGEKTEDTEVCRISITCVPTEPSTSSSEIMQPEKSDSPPIVIEELFKESTVTDEDIIDVDGSRKSTDVNLDSSFNKAASPTSSVTSHRKLEWDSLADVGYENSRKTSAAGLSTLERMAIQQQYSNSDEIRSEEILGFPKASSTVIEGKGKSSKNHKPKNPKRYIQKNTDSVEVTIVPSDDQVQAVPINVNLTKHISFNMNPNENIMKKLTYDKEVVAIPDQIKELSPEYKKISESNNQNSTTATEGKETSPEGKVTSPEGEETSPETGRHFPKYTVPLIVNIGSVKRFRRRRRKFRKSRVKARRRVDVNLEESNFDQNNQSRDVNEQKSGDQCSEADSFEYMPGHIYNEKGRKNTIDCNLDTETTTDTSKQSKKSLTKDIELSIDKLRKIAQNPNADKNLKKQLNKRVLMNLVKKIIDTKYKDDDSDDEYLSGLTFDSDIIGIEKIGDKSQGTSFTNSSEKSTESAAPKSSVLKSSKVPLSAACSSTQSAPNVSYTKNMCNKRSKSEINAAFLEPDSKLQTSSEEPFEMTSKNLLSKYLDALKTEEMHKEKLQAKHNLLRRKLSSNLGTLAQTKKSLSQPDIKKTEFKDLIDNLSSQPFVGEAGDTIGSLPELSHPLRQNQRHANISVFTMRAGRKGSHNSSGDGNRPKSSAVHSSDKHIETTEPLHYCCCPLHLVNADISKKSNKENISSTTDTDDGDSISKQGTDNPKNKKHESHLVNIDMAKPTGSDCELKKSKFICFCSNTDKVLSKIPKNFVVFKCRKLSTKKNTQLPANSKTDSKPHTEVKVSSSESTSTSTTTTNTNDESRAPETIETRSPNRTKVSIHKNNKRISLSSYKCSTSEQSHEKGVSNKQDHNENNENYTKKDRSVSESNPTSPRRSYRKSTITYVSIDPKIPEPTLADVKVLSEDVVKKVESILSAVSHSVENVDENQSLLNILSLGTSKTMINNQSTADFQRRSSYPLLENTKRDVTQLWSTDPIHLPSDRQKQPEIYERKSSEIGINTEEAYKTDTSTSPRPTNLQASKLQNTLSTIMENQVSVGVSPIFFSDIVDGLNNKTDEKADSLNLGALSDKTEEPGKNTIKNNEKSTVYSFKRGFAKITVASQLSHPNKHGEINMGKEKAITKNSDDKKTKSQSPKPSTSGTQDTSDLFKKEPPYENRKENNYLATVTNKNNRIPNRFPDDKTFKSQSISSSGNTSSIAKDVSKVTGYSAFTSTKAASGQINSSSCQSRDEDDKLQSTREKIQKSTCPKSPSKSANDVQNKISNAGSSKLYSEPIESSGKNEIIRNISKIIGKYSQEGKPHRLNSKHRKRCYIEIIDALKCLLDMDSAVMSESNTTDNTNDTRRYSTQRSRNVSKSSQKKKSPNAASSSDAASTAFQRVPARTEYIDNTCQCCEKFQKHNEKEYSKNQSSVETSDSPMYSRTQYTPEFYRCCVKGKSKSELKKSNLHCFCHPQKGTLYLEENMSSNSSNTEPENPCQCKCNLHKERKKSVAYNIIIKPSKSVVPVEKKKRPPLENIYVKVPKKFKEPGVSVPMVEIRTVKEKSRERTSKEPSMRGRDSKDRKFKDNSSYATSSKERPPIAKTYKRNSSKERTPSKTRSTNERPPTERSPKNKPPKQEERAKEYYPEERFFVENNEKDKERKSKRSKTYPEDDTSLLEPNILTLKESLEKNRPDFIANSEERQHALKVIHEARSRAATFQKRLLSMPLDLAADLTTLKFEDLEHLAREIGIKLRERLPAPKFTSEREMKRHSQQIYRRLPEVQRKKEVLRKERIKQTNLLMASLFNKNLQKRTLRGEVNVSNYSAVIKI